MFVALSANVDVMHVGSLFLIGSDRNRGSNCGLGNLLYLDVPLIFRFLEVGQSEFRLSV